MFIQEWQSLFSNNLQTNTQVKLKLNSLKMYFSNLIQKVELYYTHIMQTEIFKAFVIFLMIMAYSLKIPKEKSQKIRILYISLFIQNICKGFLSL